MTDEQIIKALECCPLDDIGGCRKIDALDLITRQKAENERLQTRIGELIRQYNNDIEKVESRVIQDFAKKLKKRFKGFPMYNYSEINNEINNLVHFYPCIKEITAIEHDSLCETETYKGGE